MAAAAPAAGGGGGGAAAPAAAAEEKEEKKEEKVSEYLSYRVSMLTGPYRRSRTMTWASVSLTKCVGTINVCRR